LIVQRLPKAEFGPYSLSHDYSTRRNTVHRQYCLGWQLHYNKNDALIGNEAWSSEEEQALHRTLFSNFIARVEDKV